MPQNGKFEVGKDKSGTPVCLGDMVEKNGDKNWFVGYRYGKIMLKRPGMMAMISSDAFDNGDFSSVEKLNVFGAGQDWLIIGNEDDPFIIKINEVIK